MNNPPDLSHLVISQFWRILKMDYPSPVWKRPWMIRKRKDIQMPGWPQRSELNSFLQAWGTYWCDCFSLLDGILVHSVVTPGEDCPGAPTTVFLKQNIFAKKDISLEASTYYLLGRGYSSSQIFRRRCFYNWWVCPQAGNQLQLINL